MDADIIETVRLLLQVGSDVNVRDHEGWTPLHIAASWSLFGVTDVLQQNSREVLDWGAETYAGQSVADVCDNTVFLSRYRIMLEGSRRL